MCVCVCVCVLGGSGCVYGFFCERGEKSCCDLDEDSQGVVFSIFLHSNVRWVSPELRVEELVPRASFQRGMGCTCPPPVQKLSFVSQLLQFYSWTDSLSSELIKMHRHYSKLPSVVAVRS